MIKIWDLIQFKIKDCKISKYCSMEQQFICLKQAYRKEISLYFFWLQWEKTLYYNNKNYYHRMIIIKFHSSVKQNIKKKKKGKKVS